MKHTLLGAVALLSCALFVCSCASNQKTAASIPADEAIAGVSVIGTIGMDGSKPRAIVVEYDRDLSGAKLDLSTFVVWDYGLSLSEKDLNSGKEAGKPLAVYLNEEPELSQKGGTKSGRYVIIEVNIDYSVGRYARSYKATMAAGVRQTKPIVSKNCTITPSSTEKGNYYDYEYIGIDPQTLGKRPAEHYRYAKDGTYTIPEIEGFELHQVGNGAFKARNCFDEANGKYWDFELPYALYVPSDYDASKKYALVLHLHDAGSMDIDPMLTLCESQGAANYASSLFRDLLKAQGLDGAIVVCPAISEDFYMNAENPHYNLRIARDNWTLSCAAPAALSFWTRSLKNTASTQTAFTAPGRAWAA